MSVETTVIIPTFDRPELLRGALAALAATKAGADAFEIIVVDDGGAADLPSVVRERQADLDVRLLRQSNQGPAAARNLAASQALGSLLAFTDDDCRPEAGWVAALLAAHRRAPQALIGGRTLNILPDNRWSVASQVIVEMAQRYFNGGAEGPRFFASNNFAVPAASYRELGGFSGDFRFASEDRDLCDRWHHQGRPFVYEPAARVGHAHELSARKFWQQHYRYGFGARQYHRERRRRSSGRLRDDFPFHLQLPRLLRDATPELGPLGRVRLLPMLAVWQLANAAGFFCAPLHSRRRGGPPGSVQPTASSEES